MLAFVLDLGISVSVNFRPCKAFAKKGKRQDETQFWDCVADGFNFYFLMVFVSFFWGHAALTLCLPNLKLMVGHGACANLIFERKALEQRRKFM